MTLTRNSSAGGLVPLADLKAYLREDGTEQDAVIVQLEIAAASYLEQITARVFSLDGTAQFDLVAAGFSSLRLPIGTTAINAVGFIDDQGDPHAMAAADFELQGAPSCPRLVVTDPPALSDRPDAVTVSLTGGEAPSANFLVCVMMLVSHFFDERGPSSVAALRSPALAGLPQRIRWLIEPERRTGA